MTFRKPALFICCLFVIGAGGIRTLVALPVRGVTPWEQMAAVDGQGITVDSGGTLVHRPGLFYRWEAAQQQVDGTVIAELVVDERGDVIDARILSGPDAFRRTVLQSVLQWQYSPDGSGNRRIQARIDFLHSPTTAATPPPAPSRGTSSDSGFNLRINVEPPNQTLPTESEPLSSSEVTVAPKLVNKVDPLYSAEARRVRYQGTVVLEAIVRTDGSVQITRIVRSLDGNFGGNVSSWGRGWKNDWALQLGSGMSGDAWTRSEREIGSGTMAILARYKRRRPRSRPVKYRSQFQFEITYRERNMNLFSTSSLDSRPWFRSLLDGPRVLSALMHVTMVILALIPWTSPSRPLTKSLIDIVLYSPAPAPLLLPADTKSGGGGGGGKHQLTAPSLGRLPRAANKQFVPPDPEPPKNPDPTLIAEPTVVAPQLATLPQLNLISIGDPQGISGPPSSGPGGGGGIGTSNGRGIGPGKGPGAGPGEGGGSEGGAFTIGGGVSAPVLVAKVTPEYSEEARKARYQGTVVLDTIVREDGSVQVVRVVHALGFGLDQQAIDAVLRWKFRPARMNGKPVASYLNVEVNFNLR